jgi:hypothetical protein
MRTLYDVFKAIQADEGDHVEAMKVCLDPNVALVSPSIEKRILTAVALSTTAAFFLSGAPLDPSDLASLDGAGTAATEGFNAMNLVEGVIAGGATLASQLMPGGGGVSVNTVEGIFEGAEGIEATSAFGAVASSIVSGVAGLVAGIIAVGKLPRNDEREKTEAEEIASDQDD